MRKKKKSVSLIYTLIGQIKSNKANLCKYDIFFFSSLSFCNECTTAVLSGAPLGLIYNVNIWVCGQLETNSITIV